MNKKCEQTETSIHKRGLKTLKAFYECRTSIATAIVVENNDNVHNIEA